MYSYGLQPVRHVVFELRQHRLLRASATVYTRFVTLSSSSGDTVFFVLQRRSVPETKWLATKCSYPRRLRRRRRSGSDETSCSAVVYFLHVCNAKDYYSAAQILSCH